MISVQHNSSLLIEAGKITIDLKGRSPDLCESAAATAGSFGRIMTHPPAERR